MLWFATATHNIKWMKIIHNCLIWAQTFANLYTRRQINLYRTFFADFSVYSQPILTKFSSENIV